MTNFDKYRDLLEQKKAELSASDATRTAAPTDGTSRSSDWIDQSSLESDLHVRLALQQTDSKLLRAIDEALARIEVGTYGVCMECEEMISHARLEAVPWTRVCIACKEKQSSK